jgi:hypothetical protein
VNTVDMKKLTLGDRIVVGAGVVLLLMTLVFPWHRYALVGFGLEGTVEIGAYEGKADAVAWPAVIAALVVIAVVAVVLVRKLTAVELPNLPIPWNQAIFYATVAVPALLVLKIALKTDHLSFWAYLDVLAGAVMAYGGFLVSKET